MIAKHLVKTLLAGSYSFLKSCVDVLNLSVFFVFLTQTSGEAIATQRVEPGAWEYHISSSTSYNDGQDPTTGNEKIMTYCLTDENVQQALPGPDTTTANGWACEKVIESQVEQGVVAFRRDHDNVATATAVAAAWASARYEFLTPERQATVAAVARLHPDFCFVDKHYAPPNTPRLPSGATLKRKRAALCRRLHQLLTVKID